MNSVDAIEAAISAEPDVDVRIEQRAELHEAIERGALNATPPITWARFIMLAEAAGIRADDELNAILWFEDRRQVGLDRDENGKAVLY